MNTTSIEELQQFLEKELTTLHIPYTHNDIEQFFTYIHFLKQWNSKTNLVGKNTLHDIFWDLCIDSVYLAHSMEQLALSSPRIADFGAGAGIPGIPLRCLYKKGIYTMIECRDKRILFLENILRKLNLPNTNCIHGRVEEIYKKNALLPNSIVSRAFMPPSTLLPFTYPLLEQGGYCILMLNTELKEHAGYTIEHCYAYSIMEKTRYIVVLKKE